MPDVATSADPKRPKSGSETRSSVAIFLRIPAVEHSALADRARDEHITVQELIRRAAVSAVIGQSDGQRRVARSTLSEGDRVLLASLKRSLDSLAGLLIQNARDERRARGLTNLWQSIERQLSSLNDVRRALDNLVKPRR